MALTAKQEAFCHEFRKDRNGARAAIRAGCSEKSAKVTASRWLTKANVAARIAELDQKAKEKAGITEQDVIARLWVEAQREGDDSSPAARVSALSWLGKHFGMFTEKIEHSGEIGGVLVVPGAGPVEDWGAAARRQQATIPHGNGKNGGHNGNGKHP